jgi:hypothetical protein
VEHSFGCGFSLGKCRVPEATAPHNTSPIPVVSTRQAVWLAVSMSRAVRKIVHWRRTVLSWFEGTSRVGEGRQAGIKPHLNGY